MRRIEIGPGDRPVPGFEAVDSVPRNGVEHFAEWGRDPLPFEAESVDAVFASHVLEHVPWHQTDEALAEVFRILRPGGRFEVWVPNFSYIADCYQRGVCGDGWRKHNPDDDPMTWLNGRIFTYGPGLENYHRAVFNEAHLRSCLERAGFISVFRLIERTLGTSHGRIDLGMEGFRP